MTRYTFGPQSVVNPATGLVERGATGGKFVSVKNGPAIPVLDLNGTALTELTSSAYGESQIFQADDVRRGLVQYGDIIVTVWANEIADELAGVQAAIAAVASSAADASAAATAAATAAASAQQALAQVQAFINQGGTGSGLSTAALETYLGGSLLSFAPVGVYMRVRINATTWEPKRAIGRAISVGTAPGPTDAGPYDLEFLT